MISDEKLRHYAVNFLKEEIAAIDKTLKNVRTEGEKELLQNLQRDLIHDLEEIERERKIMALDKVRIYGYAKAYLESVTTLLKDKSEEAEGDRYIGDEHLLRSALNQYEDDLRELEKIMEGKKYE